MLIEPDVPVVSGSREAVYPPLPPSFSVRGTSGGTRSPGSYAPSDRVSAGADFFGAEGTRLGNVRSTFEEAQRLHSMVSFWNKPFEFRAFPSLLSFLLQAFDKLKSELLRREARLRKTLAEEKSLRLLCNERELARLRYEASRILNYESYLKE